MHDQPQPLPGSQRPLRTPWLRTSTPALGLSRSTISSTSADALQALQTHPITSMRRRMPWTRSVCITWLPATAARHPRPPAPSPCPRPLLSSPPSPRRQPCPFPALLGRRPRSFTQPRGSAELRRWTAPCPKVHPQPPLRPPAWTAVTAFMYSTTSPPPPPPPLPDSVGWCSQLWCRSWATPCAAYAG